MVGYIILRPCITQNGPTFASHGKTREILKLTPDFHHCVIDPFKLKPNSLQKIDGTRIRWKTSALQAFKRPKLLKGKLRNRLYAFNR
jgi:hypothetical protein